MEVRPGYKQTDAGVIPETWDTFALKQIISDMLQGVNTAIDKPEYVDNGIPMLKANNVIDGEVIFEGADHISCKTYSGYSDRFKAKRNDFLFSNIGARLGTGSLLKLDVECSFAWNVMRIVPNPRKVSPEYLCFLINSPKYSQEIRSKQSGSGMGFVPKGVMQELLITLPNCLEEQQAVVEVLNDVGALIASLEKFIAKKRDLKQASMQQLLSGQTRLPGFHGEWEVKELGKLGKISGGGVDKKIRSGEPPVRLVNYMDVYRRSFIYSNELSHVVSASSEQAARCAVRQGDVFFTPSSEMPFDIAASAVAMEDIPDAAYSYHVVRLRLDEDWDLLFRAYAFKSENFLKQAARASEGSGVRYVITQGRFRQLTVRVPPNKAEQTAIAEVLSDMDAELAVLEQRLAKTRDLKQGMMQELLTGRTRLV